jgi:hypothetical protein
LRTSARSRATGTIGWRASASRMSTGRPSWAINEADLTAVALASS